MRSKETYYIAEEDCNKMIVTGCYDNVKEITPDIISRLREGSPDAYKAVYMMYHLPVEKLLSFLLHSEQDAEEFAQDIMAQIWERRSELDPSKNIGGLIYTMARRQAFSFIRHKDVEKRYIDEQTAQRAEEYSTSGDDLMIASEVELLIEFVLNRMPEKRRQIYRMSREEGLSYEEIAKRVNLSNKSVEYHISQALKDLKKLMELMSLFFTLP